MPEMENQLGPHEVGIYVSEDESIYSEEEVDSETILSDEEKDVGANSESGEFEAQYSVEEAPTFQISGEDPDGSLQQTASVTDDEEHTVPMILHPGKQGGRRKSPAVFIGNREQEKARALFALGEVKRVKHQQTTLIVGARDDDTEASTSIVSGEDQIQQPTTSVTNEDGHTVPMILHPGTQGGRRGGRQGGRQGGRRKSSAVLIGNREQEKARALFVLDEVKRSKQQQAKLIVDNRNEDEKTQVIITSEEDITETHQPSTSVSDAEEPDEPMVLRPGRQSGRRQPTAVAVYDGEPESRALYQFGEIASAGHVSPALLTDDADEETSPTFRVAFELAPTTSEPFTIQSPSDDFVEVTTVHVAVEDVDDDTTKFD